MKAPRAAVLFVFLGLSHSFGLYQSVDPDQLQIDQLAKDGIDMSKPQRTIFTLHFSDVDGASKGCVSVYGKKFDVESDRPEKAGEKWTCTAKKTLVPELKVLRKIRRDFDAIAAANRGSYDGWKIEPGR